MSAAYKPLPGHTKDQLPSKQAATSTVPQQQSTTASTLLTTAAWVAFWIVVSVSIIIVNKHVMTYSGFNFPISLALWHMLLGSITARAAVYLLNMPDTIREQASPQLYFQVGMIGVLFGGTLVTGNAALQVLTVPTVQMLKASGPATIYFMGIVMGNEQLGWLQTLKVAVVCTGVGIASYGDISLNAVGFALQLASIIMDATRCCALQKVMQTNHIEVGPLVTLAHVAPFAMAALSLPAVMLEGPRLLNEYDRWSGAAPMVLLSGLLASVLNLVVFKIIRLTSALTTSLSGVLKEWACILVAMYVYGTHVTQLQWAGYSIAIAGLLWYQSSRLKAAQAKLVTGDQKPTQPLAMKGHSSSAERPVVIHVTASSRAAATSAVATDSSRTSSWGGAGDAAAGAAASRPGHSGSLPLLRIKV